ncbi:unnamed protein product [Eruca vesicaria subsp. sativa]|uniref:Uncharacterized protein n=1 Tax=Eruca vesicaria subsp. sativa TaxID=29727 RepID=A0ABC8M8K8_ERUVS|nr:unnamed protein product [Eruca vesicaria subsp. sativa]
MKQTMNQEGAEEQMGRSGDAAKMYCLVINTVISTCIGIKKKRPVETTHSHENAGFIRVTVRPDNRSVSCEDGDGQKLPVSGLGTPLTRVSDEKNTNSCSTDTTITDIALRGEEDNEEEVLSLCSSGV